MNKKVVIIITLVECILAVLLISIFGQAIYSVHIKDVAEIHFVDENGRRYEDDEIVEITLTDDKLTYQLNWVVLPEDAANKGVTFTLSRDIAIVSGTGVITFFDEGSVTIIMSTNDGRRITDSLMIVATFDD